MRARTRLRAATTIAVTGLLAGLGIGTALPAAADYDGDGGGDALCYTSTSNGDTWYDGDSASYRYDNVFWRFNNSTDRSVIDIPAGLLEDEYVPQGLAAVANWNGTSEDILLISAYRDTLDGDTAEDGPSRVYGVVASGSRSGTGLGYVTLGRATSSDAALWGHVGGLAVYRGYVHVGSEQAIYAYPWTRIKNGLAGASSNTPVRPSAVEGTSYTVGFMGSGGGYLWAGRFEKDTTAHLNRYVHTSGGNGLLTYQHQLFAPAKTQGVAVTDQGVVFTTSWTRGDRSNVWVFQRGVGTRTDANNSCFRAPSMIEGVTTLNGRAYVIYEGAAYKFLNDGGGRPRNVVSRIHSADLGDLFGLLANAERND
jgi:hypothetical protein